MGRKVDALVPRHGTKQAGSTGEPSPQDPGTNAREGYCAMNRAMLVPGEHS